jgi:hypothetical protein
MGFNEMVEGVVASDFAGHGAAKMCMRERDEVSGF